MSESSGGAGPRDRSGPDLGEETRRIVGAVQDWMQRSVPAAHGGPDCQWCPICQFAGVLRGERPEVADKLAQAGAALADALRAVIELAGSPQPAQPPGPPSAPAAAQRRRPRPRVERIDLDTSVASGPGAPPASDLPGEQGVGP